MTESEKQEILRSLRGRSADELWGYIKNGDITLDEMKDAGGMIRDIIDEINNLQKNLNAEKKAEAEKETAFWNESKNKHTRQSYNDYLTKYPDGRYKSQAEESITLITKEESKKRVEAEIAFWNECNTKGKKIDYVKYIAAYPNGIYKNHAEACLANIDKEKHDCLEKMKDRPEDFDNKRLQKILDEGILEESDLIKEGIITQEALKLYLNPPLNQFINQKEWGSSPKIQEGKTDIYFFGIPGSGKSCVLAGTLYAAHKKGILRCDIKETFGYTYINELIKCIEIGYIPLPTDDDSVNCLSFSLIKNNKTHLKNNKTHPLNVIEMSGEIFINTYQKLVGDKSRDKSITIQKYLENKNRKIIFFVIDYRADSASAHTKDLAANQTDKLTAILEILKNDGILKQTDGIVVIISKSDYMPQAQNKSREEIAKNYLNDNYLNFMKILGEHLRSYKINRANGYKPYVIPFSLGKFMLGRTFICDLNDSNIVVDNLLTLSRIKRKRWF
jgi:hypothetical protein